MTSKAHEPLLGRVREIIKETPKSGALNAAKQPYYPTRFEAAVERRSGDGARLVDYIRAKIHEAPTSGYDALIAVGRPDLTAEAVTPAQPGHLFSTMQIGQLPAPGSALCSSLIRRLWMLPRQTPSSTTAR